MTKSYFHMIKDYTNPEKIVEDKKYERTRFSDDENKEINEIFDEDDLDEYNIPNKTIH